MFGSANGDRDDVLDGEIDAECGGGEAGGCNVGSEEKYVSHDERCNERPTSIVQCKLTSQKYTYERRESWRRKHTASDSNSTTRGFEN